jgi:ABC-type transport system substrate-binding protein/DNA-binding SARP family transcriptional activator/DNA-binding beta-propeller fold protein YncE
MPATDVRLLGPIELTLDGRGVEVGASKQRAVLAILALRPNAVVGVHELIDGLWGDAPPATAAKLIQQYVSQLRKLLADGDAQIVTHARGYELRARPDAVDVASFERLADAAVRGEDDGKAARAALELWRGTPLSDVIDEPFAAAELRRLEELWLSVTEHAIADDLDAGRHDEAIARLDGLVERHPLRERLHALRMRALYASGRQAEALEAFRRARAILVEEIGIEPGPELQRLHEAMLRQDPELATAAQGRRRPAPAPAKRHIPRALIVAAAAAVLIGAIAFAVSRITAPDHLDGIDENAVGRVDAASAEVVGQYTVGREPRALATGAGSVWVADTQDETVSRLEADEDRVVTIPVGSDPVALAFGAGALWVAERGDLTVAQISPASNKVVRRIETSNAPSAIAAGSGAVWVTSAEDQTVSRVPVDGSGQRRRIHLGAPPSGIAAGAGAVWVTSEESGTLFRIEPRTGTVVKGIRVGNRPVAVAAGESGVWVVNRQDATVWRIDPATNSVTDTIAVPRDPGAIAGAGSDVWVAAGDASLSRIDGRMRRVVGKLALGNPATALALDGGSVWTATQPAPARHRGGTVTVEMPQFSFPFLEPAAYDPYAIEVLSLVYDGLVAYRRTGGTTFGPLVADLAADVPEPSADGRTYVFRLRRGIRFADGTPLEPDDFRASLEALLRRNGRQLPTFFDTIVGGRRCVQKPRACDLSAGIVTDPRERTITVRLTRPDPFLLHKLAHPLAYVAPAEQPFGPDRQPPGTGPYRVVDFDQRSGVELARNPHFQVWSKDARPDGLADRIRVRVAAPQSASVAAVERGDVDVVTLADAFGSNLPPNELDALATRRPDRLHTSATPSLFYLWMNVREPPFDDVRVRRALNYAIDRRLVAELEGGDPLAHPACHFVAAGHPGYSPACKYTRDAGPTGIWSAPDLDRASALIERSGTAGQDVTVAVPADKRRVGSYIARLLDRLGYRSRLQVPGDYGTFHSYAADSRNHVQIGTDGWAADFPTPLDFTTPYTCGNEVPGSPDSINLAQLCDREFDRRIEVAVAARGSAADAAWRSVYDRLASVAPAAPLVNRRGAVFTSSRLGNYQHHPLFGVLLDQVWVR